jgi:hypothetical protein
MDSRYSGKFQALTDEDATRCREAPPAHVTRSIPQQARLLF